MQNWPLRKPPGHDVLADRGKRSLLKRTMGATDFVFIRIQSWENGRSRARLRWSLGGRGANDVVGMKTGAEFVCRVGLENIVGYRFAGNARKTCQHSSSGS